MSRNKITPSGKAISTSIASFENYGNPVVITCITMDSGDVWHVLTDLRNAYQWELVYSPKWESEAFHGTDQ